MNRVPASATLVNAAGGARGGRRRGFAKHSFAPPEPARLARRAVQQLLVADPPAFSVPKLQPFAGDNAFEAEVHGKGGIQPLSLRERGWGEGARVGAATNLIPLLRAAGAAALPGLWHADDLAHAAA